LTSVDQPATDVAQAIERAKASDEDAFAFLYRLTLRGVYRYVSVRVPTADNAEEVTQEVYMAAVAGLGSLRASNEAGLYAWLYQIARNKAADFLRQRYRRPADPLPDGVVVADGRPSAQDLLEHEVEREQVRHALQQLTPEQREVLLCKYVMDYSNDQTARQVGKNVNAVNQLHHRALASLARLLRDNAYA